MFIKNFFRTTIILVSFFLIGSGTPLTAFAQTTPQNPRPSDNCPASVYDQARKVYGYKSQFGVPEDFDYFYATYKKFLKAYSAQSGSMYHVFQFNRPTTVGWNVLQFEAQYTYPIFPNGNPTIVYPNPDQFLPGTFPLSKIEIDNLNAIYKRNTGITDQFMTELWGLRYFEEVCGNSIDINNIPTLNGAPGKTGYGIVAANSQSFTVDLDPDLEYFTTESSITIRGSIHVFKEVTPRLKLAYTLGKIGGKEQDNLNKLSGIIFNTPINTDGKGLIDFTLDNLKKTAKDEAYFFAVVDADKPTLAYTGVDSLQTVKYDNQPNYSLPNITGGTITSDTSSLASCSDGLDNDDDGVIDSNDSDCQNLSSAAKSADTGLISCGKKVGEATKQCGWNDFIRLIARAVKFLFVLVLPILAIGIAWVGFLFMKDGGEAKETAKKMLGKMIWGIILIFGAWFIVNTVLQFTLDKNIAKCYNWLKAEIPEECNKN